MIKVLLDTDIGDDIDDAFALALCCAEPSIDLVAVTTVFKNTTCRTQQVKQFLEVYGKNIPVYTGCTTPYHAKFIPFEKDVGNPIELAPCQYDEGMAHYQSDGDAVDNLVALAERYKGELVVVAVGPLTNIAKAIERDANFAKNVKKIVLMGGWFTNFVPEWNVLCDPQATQIVYQSGAPVYSVGLDVTLQCPLEETLLDKVRQSDIPHCALVATWLARWFEYFHFKKSVLHDPVAVSTLFCDACVFEQKYCKVVLEEQNFGAVQVSTTPKQGFYPINVATAVDSNKFYQAFEQLFFAQPK